MRLVYGIALLMIFTLLACNQAVDAPKDLSNMADTSKVDLSKEKVELIFWSHYGGWEDIIIAFEKKYPNVNVTAKTFTFDSYVEIYEKAIANGKAPDVMIADSEHFGRFASINGLENLLNLGAGKYRDDFSSSLWDINFSFDGKSLIGFPSGSSPMLTYYRADLMEQYGFPSDPEELGTFMEDPKNWLEIGRVLKKDNRYITQWPMDVVQMFDSTEGIFTEDMKFARNNKKFRSALEIASTVYNEGLSSSTDTWTKSGEESLKTGKVAMLYMGTWGAEQIETWAPKTAGLWRQTRLPFNLYGWLNSSSFMIPTSSDKKEWAFEFIKFSVTEYSMDGIGNSVPSYLPARNTEKRSSSKNVFFGGQNLYKLNEFLANQMKETRVTAIDVQAESIWTKVINAGIERDRNEEIILDDAQKEIVTTLGREIDILKQYLVSHKLIAMGER